MFGLKFKKADDDGHSTGRLIAGGCHCRDRGGDNDNDDYYDVRGRHPEGPSFWVRTHKSNISIGGPVQDFLPFVFFPGRNHFLPSLSKMK